MKKWLLVSVFLLASLCFSFADLVEEESILLSLNVEKHMYIISTEDLALGEISSTGSTSDSGTVYIRSNRKRWTFGVYADKGALTEWDPAASSYVADASTIPYSFTFNSPSSLLAEKIVAQPVPTVSANSLQAFFNRPTLYGSNGEPFIYSIEVSAASGSDDWTAGNYHDVLHLWLSVY